MRTRHRWQPLLLAPILALFLLIFQTLPAYACGGLVAPDGSVRLQRAATLIAWHDGIEHYMTSFTYEGDVKNLGWIVPLPSIPLSIQEGGAWTLQRLVRETRPTPIVDLQFGAAAPAANAAVVIQQVKVEALNITVLKGSGQEVLNWCAQNGFVVEGDTRAHLLKYAAGSPIFMAAKYDTAAVQARHQISGDGAPVLITMRTPHIWVPLEVLALDGQQVNADLYLLTDDPVTTSKVGAVFGQTPTGTQVPGAQGLVVNFQERMNPTLYHDLSTDRNMSWVRPDGWLTYLSLDAPSEQVTYDLSVTPDGMLRTHPYGASPLASVDSAQAIPTWVPRFPIGTPQVALTVFLLAMLGALIVAFTHLKRYSRP